MSGPVPAGRNGYGWITFLTDYGLDDNFVGVCHGVIARTAPAVRVIDITHTIQPQDVREGALVLAQSVPYMPRAVHLAVVDPGVGTKRRGVVLAAGDSLLVGPDNGLLVWAAEALGKIREARVIANPAYQLPKVSRTFHGRDVFAPVAAHLAGGLELERVGAAIDPGGLERLAAAACRVEESRVHGEVVLVDHFGNLQLNVTREHLAKIGVGVGDRVDVRVGGRRQRMPFAETFAAVAAGRPILCEDSFQQLALAVNTGRADEVFQVNAGDPVVLSAATD